MAGTLKRCIYEKLKKMSMTKKIKCEYCEKEAIGFQSLEGGFDNVCQDHAHSLLLELKPGEKKVFGVCVFERFGTTDT